MACIEVVSPVDAPRLPCIEDAQAILHLCFNQAALHSGGRRTSGWAPPKSVGDLCCGVVQTNAFMMQLITHLQSDAVPAKVPECLRDVRAAFEAATLEDLYVWYDQLQLSDDSIFTCIGTSGPQVSTQQIAMLHLHDWRQHCIIGTCINNYLVETRRIVGDWTHSLSVAQKSL